MFYFHSKLHAFVTCWSMSCFYCHGDFLLYIISLKCYLKKVIYANGRKTASLHNRGAPSQQSYNQ